MRREKKRNKVVAAPEDLAVLGAPVALVEWGAGWAVVVWEVDAAEIAVIVLVKSKAVRQLDLTAWLAALVAFQEAQVVFQEVPVALVGLADFQVAQEDQVVWGVESPANLVSKLRPAMSRIMPTKIFTTPRWCARSF